MAKLRPIGGTNFRLFPFAALLAILFVSSACRNHEAAAAGAENAPAAAAVDLSAYKPKFEFRGRIAFQSDFGGNNDIYLLTAEGLTRLTDDPASDEFPRWSPDGRSIAFSSNRTGIYQIYIMDADGSNVRRVTEAEDDAIEEGWYPDGTKLAYTEERKRTFGRSYTMWTIDLKTGTKTRLLPEFDGSSALPDFSPDASRLAFTGKRTMGWDAFLADLRTKDIRALTKGGNACRPRFSPDGTLITYVSSSADGKGDIWTMSPEGGGVERLTERPDAYDYFPAWSPDGKWIVFSSGTEHYPTEGVWELVLVKPGTKTVVPLFKSGSRDVFPDWR